MHLQVHTVVYAPHFRDNLSLEAEHSVGSLAMSDDEVRDLSGEELLNRLPHVPNVPHPGDLPMPYWLCDMCTSSTNISGQIHVNSETGKGWCKLLIKNLRRAAEFMLAAGSEESDEYQRLLNVIETIDEMPWDTLSLTVRHRLEQWYRPGRDEEFVAYVADRDRSRSEDGMAGLIVTNRRLICRGQRRHYEFGIKEPLGLEQSTSGGKQLIRLRGAKEDIKRICIDREGLRKLRLALTESKFQTTWK